MTRRLMVAGLVCLACAGGSSSESVGEESRATRPAPAVHAPSRFGVGTPATDSLIALWNIDVNPDGVGLPAGRGSASEGAVVFAQKCASCHGAAGQGIPPVAPIVGREPREGFPFGSDPKLVKTVGNYWPYATTLFDYVRRAMPQNAPGSLTPNELYAVVAWVLAANEIVAQDAVLDATTLPAVKMPARDRFVVDDRRGGTEFKE
jgi:S-disulfanyl-L-cysteine oxidoreductase SoxD